jgi:phosphatidylglycerol:prolipoprotein diacylglycerol transferase
MEGWTKVYEHFDPIAFDLLGIGVHWYGIMYVTALLVAIWMAKFIVKRDKLPISDEELDSYILWAEIGVILGARIGYILFYSTDRIYYLTQPWQMFNPYVDGQFVGISGMSYHGAIIGFMIATFIFARRYRMKVWTLLDIIAIAAPLGFIFGRIGNFLNQELIGRATDVAWAIEVHGVLRHPSQLYEAVLEGIVIFVIIYAYRNLKQFDGELIALYGILYSLARFVAEFFREPDPQLGFICCGWMSMGQAMSIAMGVAAIGVYIWLIRLNSSSVFKARN